MSTESAIETRPPSTWSEDLLLVGLFAVIGVLGIGVGIATDSQVQTSIGLILVAFAAKVLFDIGRTSGAGPLLRRRSPRSRRPTEGTCSRGRAA
jgi:hypothetical protein